MYVVVARCELHLPAVHSLKGKRAILNRIKDKLRGSGKAAVAEVDHNELWQRCALGIAVVSSSSSHAEETLESLRRIVERELEIVILDWHIDRY